MSLNRHEKIVQDKIDYLFSEISIKIGSGPTEINFRPISACEDSISVTETAFDSCQGSQTLTVEIGENGLR